MYYFKKEKRDEILQGRKVKYVAENILHITPTYLCSVLKSKIGCSYGLAYRISSLINCENIEEYFIKKEK